MEGATAALEAVEGSFGAGGRSAAQLEEVSIGCNWKGGGGLDRCNGGEEGGGGERWFEGRWRRGGSSIEGRWQRVVVRIGGGGGSILIWGEGK